MAGLEASLGTALLNLLAQAREDVASPEDDAQTAARRLAEEGSRLLPGSESAICSPRPADRAFTVVATSGGAASRLEGRSWPRRGSIMQRATEGEAAVEATNAEELNVVGSAMREAGFGSVRAIPLAMSTPDATQPHVVGVYLAMRPGNRGFTESERHLLDAYSPLVALAMLRAEQQKADASTAKRLALGVDVALDLASAVTPGEVHHRILVRTTDAVDADRASLIRLDLDDLIVEDTFDRDGRPGFPGRRTPLRNYPAYVRALTTRAVERVPGGMTADIPEDGDALVGTRHSLVMPLVFGGHVTGFLSLHRRRGAPFSDSDVITLQLINNLAVLALRNARLYADAQEAKEAMAEFLDVVVHDLRSPLTVVGGYCNMMVDGVFGEAPPGWGRPLEIIESKVREAQRLVDQLLLAARLDNGDIPSSDEELDLCRLAREAVARAEPQAQLQGARIKQQVPDTSVWACADRANVEQIIDNLVNNALAYGGSPAEIEISVVNRERPGISVSDRGPGIPLDKRERIFDRFFRGHEGTQGSGLGLYVSRRLAAASRGTLELDAGWTKGSRFVLGLVPAGGRSAAG